MRIRTALLLALVMTVSGLAVPPAAGQAAGGATERSTHLADDNPGDVVVNEATQSTPAPSGRFGPADLVGLDVLETAEAFAFMLKVASLAPEGAELPATESGVYNIYFQNLDRQFRLDIFRNAFAGVNYRAQLQALDPARHAYFTVTRDAADLTVVEDLATNTITATVLRRDLLADGHGSAPHPEVPLTGWHVTSRAMGQNLGFGAGPLGSNKVPTPTATDAMPDSGNATANLSVFFGVAQTGHARLTSEIPSRASNGEATTFVFAVRAFNTGATEDRFNLVATGVPAGWQVKLPAEQVTIPGNGSVQLIILLTTPFSHTHGAYLSFLLEQRSVSDSGSVGRTQLGVRYVNPPQPAGHHPTVWLHSQAAEADPVSTAFRAVFPGASGLDAQGFMNAQETDPNDARVPVPGQLFCAEYAVNDCEGAVPSPTPGARVHYRWEIPLSPGLDMGLDFDLVGKGATGGAESVLDIMLSNQLPMPGATVGGRLLYITPPSGDGPDQGQGQGFGFAGNVTVVAKLETTAAQDVGAAATGTNFKPILRPTPAGDYLPYVKGAALLLEVELNFTRADVFFGPKDVPMLLPGGMLTMPLFEYHDPVANVFVSNVELIATSKTDRFVNPGDVALFNITLVNKGTAADTIKIEMTGTHAQGQADSWSRLIGPASPVTLEAGASAMFTLVVDVPASAARPDAADIVLVAASESDFSQRGLLHVYAIVTPTEEFDYPDERAILAKLDDGGEEASTPGLEMVALLAALGACVLAVRRRRLA